MANRWVEFVRKWAKDNNMNYMCAMTTKECKDAYLKAHPKPEKKGKTESKLSKEDVPAPSSKRKVGRPKKVVVGDAPPKRPVGRPKKTMEAVPDTEYLKTITKNANKGLEGVAEPKVKRVFRRKSAE